MVERPADTSLPQPRFAIPFVLTPEAAFQRVQEWQRQISWFRGVEIRKVPLKGNLHAVYCPAFLYSAVAYSSYEAKIGETYTVQTNNGTSTRTEWRDLAGNHAIFLKDLVVSASRGIPNHELANVEPYDLRALHRYTPALISGWPAESPSLSAQEVWKTARDEALASLHFHLQRFMPGDSNKELKFQANFQYESIDLFLVPLWVMPVYFKPNAPPFRLVINGQTGKVYAPTPLSTARILLVIFGVLAAPFVLGLILVGLLVALTLLVAALGGS